MTVSTSLRKQNFVLNGVTDEFTFTFRARTQAPTDIKCISTTGGTDTILAYTTNYTVAVNANGVGGVVTLVDAAATGSGTLTVYRETTNTQGSDYDNYNQFPADTLEDDLDIRTLVSQEQGENLDRTVTLAISASSSVSTELPTPSADTVLGWDSSGTAIENKTIVDATTLTKATQAQGRAGTNDSAFMTPLRVQDANNAAVTLTDGATVALDASLGKEFILSAGGNRTILAPTNPTQKSIIIRHYASGGARTLTLSSGTLGFRFGSTITALTETVSGKTDYIGAIYHAADTIWDVVAYAKGF
jgi:hypothetical protein